MPSVGADITDTSELCPCETRYPQNTVTNSIGTRGKKKFANPARNKKIKNAKGLSANDTAVLSNCSRRHSIPRLIYSKSFPRWGQYRQGAMACQQKWFFRVRTER